MLLLLLAALFLRMPISSFGFVISSSEITNKRSHHLQSVSSSPLVAMQMKLKSSDDSIDAPSTSTTISSSLASDYAIRIHPPPNNKNQLHWELYPLSNWKESSSDVTGVGTIALRALEDCRAHQLFNTNTEAVCKLSCQWEQATSYHDTTYSINVSSVMVNDGNDNIVPIELQCILGRIIAQSAAAQIANNIQECDNSSSSSTLLHITLPLLKGEGCQQVLLSDLVVSDDDNSSLILVGVRHLFTPLNGDHAANAEIVDMVDNNGMVLGSLPRPYIHKYNILHRGIGMVVTKDVDIIKALKEEEEEAKREEESSCSSIPEIYVHQRTSTKRVFPSLYDMFVGGVSSSGEGSKLTAAREVGEELGLTRALNILLEEDEETTKETNLPLSDKLFQCTICTSYNRCLVSMFTYTCDTTLESITWQEEEVAWGEYVPYDIVKVAADMSIERLAGKGHWPGGLGSGNVKHTEDVTLLHDKCDDEWENWDFVPDGLLVWQAWTSYISQEI